MTQFMTAACGAKVAYEAKINETAKTAVCFLPGFMSNKQGTKAQFLSAYCQEEGFDYYALDYRGHGESGGEFRELTLSDWLADAQQLLDLISKPAILVGSSMSGWLGLLLAQSYSEKIKGLVLLAPAPDFTVRLYEAFTDAQREELELKGYVSIDSGYETPHIFTRQLIEDGHNHLLMQGDILLKMPVSILQGKQDASVPWQETSELAQKIENPYVRYHLIKDADHGLSRPEDLALLASEIDWLNQD